MGLGLFICYLIGALFALWLFGLPRLSAFSRRYLFLGIPCAILCSLCFTTSLQISDGGRQTLEVGMVNYLWPSLTIIAAVLFNGQKARWYVAAGFLLSLAGLCLVLSGDEGFRPLETLHRMQANPLSYGLAFCGALAWALYSSATRAWGRGLNPTSLVFLIDAALFGGLALLGVIPGKAFAMEGILACIASGCVMGAAYAVWTLGVQKGSITVLAIASYFTPVLSCLFGALLLGATLSRGFWQGVGLVVAGSIICWIATLPPGAFRRRLRRRL